MSAQLSWLIVVTGKRYRTKKERMRMERGGPPVAADGSLDYPEMEDPFSVLSAMVPDPPYRPFLVPLYPNAESADSSFPAPINIIPTQDAPESSSSTVTTSKLGPIKSAKPAKRRHWIINRNGPTRTRIKDVGDEDTVPAWKTPREPVATDFGPYAALPSVLANENKQQSVGEDFGSEARLLDVLRQSLHQVPSVPAPASTSPPDQTVGAEDDSYWRGRTTEAEAYIRDVVYGGADGLAYARSLAEFLTPSEPVRNEEHPTYGELGIPVAHWVEANILDPLTDGRHRVLRDAARILNELPLTPPQTPPSTSLALPDTTPSSSTSDIDIRCQIELSLHAYPVASRALETLRAIHADKIDLPALINTPDELFHAEDVWAGREYREKRKREMDEALARDPEKNAAAYLQWAIAEHRE
uniref:Histone acetyltransferase n=1 Tax=Ganoderma boninense TaxID=34458 RepID=A0A5K1JWK7_9APHY|nr:Histone acetyltransferase [Ganoderma boninense]